MYMNKDSYKMIVLQKVLNMLPVLQRLSKGFLQRDHKIAYIHIGIHKTGTTSIQRYLFGATKELGAAGYFLPQDTLYNGEPSHAPLAWEVKKGNVNLLRGSIERMDVSHRILILSSEEFSYFDDTQINTLKIALQDFTVKPIIYIRNQVDYLTSLYAEWVKNGVYSGEPFVFIRNEAFSSILNYQELYHRWARRFGVENTVLKVFENETRERGGLISGFLNIVGFEPTMKSLDVDLHENVKYSPELILAARVVGALTDYYAGRASRVDPNEPYSCIKARIVRLAGEAMADGPHNLRGTFFCAEDSVYIMERFADSNAILAEEAGINLPDDYFTPQQKQERLPVIDSMPELHLDKIVSLIIHELSYELSLLRSNKVCPSSDKTG
jgi:hypothetical protein